MLPNGCVLRNQRPVMGAGSEPAPPGRNTRVSDTGPSTTTAPAHWTAAQAVLTAGLGPPCPAIRPVCPPFLAQTFRVMQDCVHCQDPPRRSSRHQSTLSPPVTLVHTATPRSHKHLCSLWCSVHLMCRTVTWRLPCCPSLGGLPPTEP